MDMSDVINLEQGDSAPNFTAQDSEGNTYDLSEMNSAG